jgi:signal transduction histidine kinase
LQIIFRLPILIAAFLSVLIILSIVLLIIVISKNRRKINLLSLEKENTQTLKQEIKNLEDKSNADRKAYEYFIQSISHEVSNPLQSVQTNLDNMIHCSVNDLEGREKYYHIISADIRRLANLTERLRLFSRLEASNKQISQEPVNIKGVIQTVIMSQSDSAENQGVYLRYLGPERIPRVLGNRESLEQVFLNLVGNSIKYSKPEGGEVIISVQEENNVLHVRVMDKGVGIPNEDLPHLFEVAYRSPDAFLSHRKGTGLGLAIVKRILEQHGSQIYIQSQYGDGTTVSFDLPIYQPE